MEENKHRGLSSFSVILVMMVFMVIGAAVLPMLNIQYSPQQKMQNLSVSFSYSDASPRVVETEATSIIEGALSSLKGVTDVSAYSYQGYGSINLSFKEGTDMESTRFAAATILRQIRQSLPEGVNPTLGGSISGTENWDKNILNYTIYADMPADRIVDYAEKHIRTPLSRIDGVEDVSTSGASPFQWVVTFDPNSLRDAGLSPSDISNAFNQHFQNSIIGTSIQQDNMMLVRLRSTDLTGSFEEIPVGKVNGRMFTLGDFAKVTYQEQPPSSYSRINGQNTIGIYVSAQEGVNTIKVATAVKDKMAELEKSFPDNFSIRQTYDASESLKEEIHKIFFRSIMSLLFLLLFVLLVSRSFRYLAIIGLSITVNILSAAIFYRLFNIDIEMYSMAGITVSLGIIIDTAIVMVDHFTYYRDRKVMVSIAGALLTTIAALLIIFFLPEHARRNLVDFVWVIIINLTLSMLVAFLFVPALLDKLPLKSKGVARYPIRIKRAVVGWSHWYERYIIWSRNHRWLFIVMIIWFFGIPIHLLPSQVHHKGDDYNTRGGLVGLYNNTIGGKWYQKNRTYFEYALGGSFNFFAKNLSSGSFYREPQLEKTLDVQANMPEGSTAQQMNEIICEMEEWLKGFKEIEMFQTSVDAGYANIQITFEREAGKTRFPYELKRQLWAKAMKYGGATWYVSSLDPDDNSLSNSTYRSYWEHTISLYGYNYDILYRYAENLRDSLLQLKRVNNAEISGNWGNMNDNELVLDLDRKKIALKGLNVSRYISYLGDQLYDNGIGTVFDGEQNVSVQLTSSQKDYFDLWHVNNDMIDIDSTKIRLSDLGTITKRATAATIQRSNQEYVISVGFDFIGSYELERHMEEQMIEKFNKIMPLGFHMGRQDYYWNNEEKRQQALLLFIVVIIIYMICAILFESLRKPLSIIVMIPLGFVGLFLAFPLLRVTFDQGGFAAMVMLCGIVVNASIYLISEYNTISAARGGSIESANIRNWIKAYNRKIIPTLLTIISTVLGLIPFLFDGKDDVFWYAFAIGVIGGMTFSVLALVMFMPVFVPLKENNRP